MPRHCSYVGHLPSGRLRATGSRYVGALLSENSTPVLLAGFINDVMQITSFRGSRRSAWVSASLRLGRSPRTHWDGRDGRAIQVRIRRMPCFAYTRFACGFCFCILLGVSRFFSVRRSVFLSRCTRRQRNWLRRNLGRRTHVTVGTRP